MSVIAFASEDNNQTSYARLPKDYFERAPRPGISPKKLAANRANAAKSTGPRTPQGKQRSAQNATTHALTATIGNYKQDPTYAIMRHELEREHRPNSPSQRLLVEELALIVFKLDLLFPQIEHQIMNTPLGATEPATPPTPNKDDPSPDPRLAAPVIAAHLLANQPTPLTRLWDYRRRLMSRYQSILRQLPKLREQHAKVQARDQQREEDRESDKKAREEWLAVYGPEAQARHLAQAEAAIAARAAATKPQTPPAQNEPTETSSPRNPEISSPEISNPHISNLPSVSSVAASPSSPHDNSTPVQNEPTAVPPPSAPPIPDNSSPTSPSVSPCLRGADSSYAHEKTLDTIDGPERFDTKKALIRRCRVRGCLVKPCETGG